MKTTYKINKRRIFRRYFFHEPGKVSGEKVTKSLKVAFVFSILNKPVSSSLYKKHFRKRKQ